jgi:molybdate transport system ATP-binding protein
VGTPLIEFSARHRRGSFELALDFSAPAEQVTVLFGPSGAGKSTALQLLAGALEPDQGRIVLGSTVWHDTATRQHVPIEKRGVGWVFQDGRLFPHLNVLQNLQFGAKRRRDRREVATLARITNVLQLEALLERWPSQLSGGERQRVALGRALLAAPRLLLLDEPTSSLDVARKRDVLTLLETIKHEFRVPMVYVTHSIAETARLADHVVLIDAGACVRHGPVTELFGRSDTPLLSDRPDNGSVLVASLDASAIAGESSTAIVDGQPLRISRQSAAIGASIRLYVFASDVILATQKPEHLSVRNALRATIERIDARVDGVALVLLRLEQQTLLAELTTAAVQELSLQQGAPVFALIKSVAIDAPGGARSLTLE